MERDRGEARAGSKHQFDDYDSDAGRRLEKQLRSCLEYAEERRQREWAASHDWDHNRSPEWRRSEDRRREDDRRAQGEPSRPQDPAKRRKVGVKKYSAKSRASTMATITPTPTPPPPPKQVPPPPPPSGDGSTPSEVQKLGGKKQGIKCFNCGRDGHFQFGCKFKAHCSLCDTEGHTTGMCPRALKLPALQWYGYAVDGVGFHCLEVEDAMLAPEPAAPEHEAVVIAGENRLTCELLSQDLKALVEDNWDWQVKHLSDTSQTYL
jgi:hypothetical protein